jgi:hypothetical protein
VLVDVDGDVHARSVIKALAMAEPDHDRDDLGEFWELPALLLCGNGEEHRCGTVLDLPDTGSKRGMWIGVDGHLDQLVACNTSCITYRPPRTVAVSVSCTTAVGASVTPSLHHEGFPP